MFRRREVLGLFLFGIILSGAICYAEEPLENQQLLNEIQGLKQMLLEQQERIEGLERKVSRQGQVSGALEPASAPELSELDQRIDKHLAEKYPQVEILKGLEMGIGTTVVVQGTGNANTDGQPRSKDATEASYSLDLTFLKKFDNFGQGFVHFQSGQGEGLDRNLKVFSSVNADADDDVNLRTTEAWYEQYLHLRGAPLTITFGKLNPTLYIDDNIYANDELTQFLGGIFVNSPAIEFPDNSGAIRLGIVPRDFFDINFLALSGNADWDDTFDGMFYAGQLNFKPSLLNRDGNYRLLGWINDQDHTEWLDTTMSKESGYGLGLSIDQELTDIFGVFLRYGWQDPSIYLSSSSGFSLEQSYSVGGQLLGKRWGRDSDVLGFAFGQVIPSNSYRKAGAALDPVRKSETESHLELYYNYRLNKYLHLTPDLQVIWDPYGKDAENGSGTIVVGGMRGQMDF